jgi:hypothetical protein
MVPLSCSVPEFTVSVVGTDVKIIEYFGVIMPLRVPLRVSAELSKLAMSTPAYIIFECNIVYMVNLVQLNRHKVKIVLFGPKGYKFSLGRRTTVKKGECLESMLYAVLSK